MKEKEQVLIQDEMSDRIIDTARQITITQGTENINVRRILQTLGITNRVFYNRFRNIDEVLKIVYLDTVLKMRESIAEDFDPEGDFFQQVTDIVAKTLVMSYDVKMNLNYYIFENDSISCQNYEWWKSEIARLIEFGKAKGVLKDVETEKMSYAVWCFIRGYNADALGRKLPKEQAVEDFKYSFGILLDGMKK